MGQILVYTGQGKGKTTAALGLAFRALGRGHKVGVVQFIKGKWMTGERHQAARTEGLDFYVMGEGFTWESEDLTRDQKAAQKAWEKSQEMINGGAHQVVILDEITYAIHYNWLALDDILQTLAARPEGISVVLTGRHAPQGLMDAADCVTEMNKVKHPYDHGQKALIGVDF
ncbi:MAG TPA: cob(I)yrinic acid a,c-diamide adenosyltransferase [Oligoflexus sp.]|uniref:cob(I)yrinic acid a,c-diamide adenosyltransferase n=1 Tax=Oligoflexus sp. TaxID=1971216 RepID=UPI002D57DEA2|nr:cob(I)yrinic acid a,c-diamide adenosyltransferase [Oligoflexus sp.]HYX35499.1 cob(I)yrinic acid a,c-diamide adenosyltransferase [Oligoflexus sp.]